MAVVNLRQEKHWREDILVQRRISPEITTSTVIAWRRNIPYSLSVRKMIVLFATSGGSGFGNTVRELQPSAPDAVITEGRLLNRGTKQEISEWVSSL